MNYVLFREDNNTHKEVYVSGCAPGAVIVADRVEDARHFTTARQAYEYGTAYGLDWWHVGQR